MSDYLSLPKTDCRPGTRVLHRIHRSWGAGIIQHVEVVRERWRQTIACHCAFQDGRTEWVTRTELMLYSPLAATRRPRAVRITSALKPEE